MNISFFIPPFLDSLKYQRDLKKTARKLLTGNSREALTQQPGFEESEYLEPNMRDSVRKCVRGKDTAIQVYKKLAEYLRKQGVPVKVAFPPVPVDNSFERLMFIAKYLQDPDARIADLPDMLWVSDRTIETDLQRLRGLDDPIQICGKPFIINDTERSGGRLRFASTAHPLFLTQNLTQILIMLKGLKTMAEDPRYRAYAQASAADIWQQLSPYARQRIRTVLGDLMAEDITWYETLEVPQEETFLTEQQLSVDGEVWMDCLKNDKTFCMEYQADDGIHIYDECRIIRYEGTDSVTIQCRQGQMTLDMARVLRSCYTLEELTDY